MIGAVRRNVSNWNGFPEERFWRSVYKTDHCWFWIGSCNSDGYGSLRVEGRTEKAHAFSYRLHYGRPPHGMHVLHRCDIRQCVRPDHLYAGTHQQNMEDKGRAGNGDYLTFRTHCPHGHEYSMANTWIEKNGNRHCRACNRERGRELRALIRSNPILAEVNKRYRAELYQRSKQRAQA